MTRWLWKRRETPNIVGNTGYCKKDGLNSQSWDYNNLTNEKAYNKNDVYLTLPLLPPNLAVKDAGALFIELPNTKGR